MWSIPSIIAVIVGASILSGCAGNPIASERDARLNYEKSVADYRACLAANPSNVKACEAQRLTMETDERAFTNMSDNLNARMSSMGGNSGNVFVHQRR